MLTPKLFQAALTAEPVAQKPQVELKALCMKRVTIIDLDRTITKRGTYSPFLLFAAWHLARWRITLVPLVAAAMVGYRMRLIQRKTLKETMQRLMIGRSVGHLEMAWVARRYADFTMKSNLRKGAFELIAREQTEGALVILATAAHRFYAKSIASRLGIAEVVATDSFHCGGSITAKIAGDNCYGKAKAVAVVAKLADLGLERRNVNVRCYSDDYSDLPCFEMSDEPIAVEPTKKLAHHARERAWRIIHFR